MTYKDFFSNATIYCDNEQNIIPLFTKIDFSSGKLGEKAKAKALGTSDFIKQFLVTVDFMQPIYLLLVPFFQ